MKTINIMLCQDCPQRECAMRTLCGEIPDNCPLPDAADNGGDPPSAPKKIPELEYTYSALRLPKFKPGTTKDPLDSLILSCLVIVKKPHNYYLFDVQGWDPSESHDKETEAEMDERWCDRKPKDRIVAWLPLGNGSNVQMHKILNKACARS